MVRSATAKDVAARAGVSQSTVSLVMNDNPDGRFTEETRRRVHSAAAELGYLPSRTARALRLGRADSVILLSPDIPSGAAGSHAIEALTELVASLGLDLVLRRLRPGQPLAVLWEAPAPAAIIGTDIPADADLAAMKAAGVAPLFVDMAEANHRIGRLQIQHLRSRGHRAVGYVGPSDPRSHAYVAARIQGVVEQCRSLGLPTPVVVDIPLDRSAAAAAVAHLKAEGVTGIAAYNDDEAFAVLAGAKDLGLRIPHDLAVVGVDSLPLGALADPPLSTIAVSQHGLVEAITALGSADTPPELQVTLQVVQREST